MFFHNKVYKIILTLGLMLSYQIVYAEQFNSRNSLVLETRIFENDHNDVTNDLGGSVFFRSENKYAYDNISMSLRGFGRVAVEDSSRNLAAFEDAWIMYRGGSGWSFKAGIETLNWTATEGFHPADIINSTNLDSNLENPEKMGEPLLSARKDLGSGNLTLYYFPDVVEPRLAESSSRLSFLPVDHGYAEPLWFDGDKELEGLANQWGARFEQTIGGADVALHYVDHYDRQQPLFVAFNSGENGQQLLRPIYLKTKNTGATYSHVFDSLIVKLEHNYKDFYDDRSYELAITDETGSIESYVLAHQKSYHLTAVGFEYSLYHDSGTETSLYLEGQWVTGLNKEERAAAFVFQRDLLVGFRHALNDVMSRELVCTAIIDTEKNEEYILTFSYRQRLSNVLSLSTGLRVVDAEGESGSGSGLAALKQSDHIFLNVSYHF